VSDEWLVGGCWKGRWKKKKRIKGVGSQGMEGRIGMGEKEGYCEWWGDGGKNDL